MSEWLLALGPWKPVLTALVLPPGGPLLLMLIGVLPIPELNGWIAAAVVTGISFWVMEARFDRACPARSARGPAPAPQTVEREEETEHILAPQYIDDF